MGQLMYLGSRRELPADSPLRGRRFGPYHFVSEERRGPARLRTTRYMRSCLRVLREEDLMHVCGFAGPPMFDKRIGFDFTLDSIPEPMHLFPRIFLFYTNVICGGLGKSTRAKSWRDRKMDEKHRHECAELGIFPEIWPQRMQRLSDADRAALLTPTDEDIERMTRPLLERWLRVVGERTSGLHVPVLKRRIAEIRRQLQQPGDFMFRPRTPSHLPWRLTRVGFNAVDERVRSLVFPLNTERVLKDGASFLNSAAATCKSAKKHMMLIRILPTVLRGFVQSVRRGLRKVVLGWRLLEGQVHSFNKCSRLGIEAGCRSLSPGVIETAKLVLVEGISMSSGAVPPSTIIPYLHSLVHYPDSAIIFGILLW